MCGKLMKKQMYITVLVFLAVLLLAPFYHITSSVITPVSANAPMPAISLISATSTADSITDEKGLGYPDSRKVVRDAKGNLYVAYRKKYRADSAFLYHIFIAKSSNNGATWVVLNQNQPIETTGDYMQRVPSLSVDNQDVLHVVWYGLDAQHTSTNDRQIKYTRSADGGRTWQPWRNIAEVNGYQDENLWQEHPIIYNDNQDKLYVVWEGRDPEHKNGQVKFTQSMDGGKTWLPWNNVAPVDAMYFSRPTLVATSRGDKLYLLAYAQLQKKQQIVWNQSSDGGATWGEWTAIAPSSEDQRHVSLAIDSQDHLHAVWRQQPAGSAANATTQIHYAVYQDGAWSTPQRISANPAMYQFFPSVAVNAQDQVWVVWIETANASDYPKEAPTAGTVYYTAATNGQWQPSTPLGSRNSALYPSLSWSRQAKFTTPDVVWLEQDNNAPSEAYIIRSTMGNQPAQLALNTR